MVSSPSSSPRLAAALLLLAAGACRKEPPSPAPSPSPAPPASTRQSPEQAKNRLAELAEADRARFAGRTFEEFRAQVKREPFPGGKYIVNGDTPIADDKHLREFWEKSVRTSPAAPTEEWSPELIVHSPGGVDAIWRAAEQRALTYCVSTAFGPRHAAVVEQMAAAAGAWEQVANVDFAYAPAQDASRPRSPRSKTSTETPSFARKYAEASPMMPPPMIATSG